MGSSEINLSSEVKALSQVEGMYSFLFSLLGQIHSLTAFCQVKIKRFNRKAMKDYYVYQNWP